MNIALRPYQEGAVKTVLEAEEPRPFVALPTGTGKTIVFAEICKRRGERALILAHRDELIRQAVDKVRMVWPDADLGVVKAEEDGVDHGVVVASIQTLSRTGRLERYLEAVRGESLTVIVDEAHHAPADSYRKVLGALAPQAWKIVGFSATPDRRGLEDVFSKIVYSKTILQMIRAGYLCDLKARQVRLADLDLADVRVRGGDYREDDLGAALELANAPEHIVAGYLREARGRKGLAFLPTVELAQVVAAKLNGAGVKAAAVWGDMSMGVRHSVLADFHEGKIQVITNYGVLLEGYDEPAISCVMVARPTKSKLLYQQMIGRGTRLYPGKDDCLILDFVGASATHDLQTLATLLGVREATVEGGIVAMLERAAGSAAAPAEASAEIAAEDVDLWSLPTRLHWIEDGPRYLLSVGVGTLALVPAGLAWEVKILEKGAERAKKLYAGVTLEYAQGIAEDYVRKAEAGALTNPTARWRREGPTEGQRGLLEKLGAWREGLTKGEASDLITRLLAGRKLR